MESVYRNKSSKQACHSGSFQRSISPSGRFCSSSISSSSSAFASSISGLSSGSTVFFTRSASPTRVNFGSSQTSPSIRFSIDRSISPGRSISVASTPKQKVSSQKKTCMCSPTTHPGSFRCSLHKNGNNNNRQNHNQATSYHSNRLYARRSAMTNSLVRIGTVEGDLYMSNFFHKSVKDQIRSIPKRSSRFMDLLLLVQGMAIGHGCLMKERNDLYSFWFLDKKYNFKKKMIVQVIKVNSDLHNLLVITIIFNIYYYYNLHFFFLLFNF